MTTLLTWSRFQIGSSSEFANRKYRRLRDRLLAEEVIDAKDRRLREHLVQHAVELARRGKVAPERFLDGDTRVLRSHSRALSPAIVVTNANGGIAR